MAALSRRSSSSSEGAPAPEVARQRTPVKSKARRFGMAATMNATLSALAGSNRHKRAKSPPPLALARPQSRAASMTSRTAGKSGISAFHQHQHDNDHNSTKSDELSVDLEPELASRSGPAIKILPEQTRAVPRTRISEGSATPESRGARSVTGSYTELSAAGTGSTSVATLPPLQTKNTPFNGAVLQPVAEDDPTSYDLYDADGPTTAATTYSLETRGERMFSIGHLQAIFDDPALLMKFTNFLSNYRQESIPTLIYYLDAVKALRSIRYANAIAEALEPLQGLEFTDKPPPQTTNAVLEDKARAAFEQMVRDDLPAYITRTFINVVSTSIHRRITGTLPPHLRETSEGLAEVFCLTDPSRPDNPIVFASEEFHRTTQYGVSYAIDRNCRFLQGPRTNKDSIKRIKDAIAAGRDHSETFVNYRRDGSPFLNLLMCAPLRDSRGKLRYFIGAQVDVSGLAKEATDLEGLQRYLASLNGEDADGRSQHSSGSTSSQEDEFRALAEMFNHAELDTVRSNGGKMHRKHVDDTAESERSAPQRPRLLLKDNSDPEQVTIESPDLELAAKQIHGRLSGVYTHYLLLRPHPSLRILFTSPSLRVPGMLQSKFLDRIGSSDRVRNDLESALAEGRGVTAKVKWLTRADDDGRVRWIHCTPLLGHTSAVGVWMVVLVDDDDPRFAPAANRAQYRRFRPAPPVAPPADRRPVSSSSANAAVNGAARNGSGSGSSRGGAVTTAADGGDEGVARHYTIGQPSIVSARSSDIGEQDFRF